MQILIQFSSTMCQQFDKLDSTLNTSENMKTNGNEAVAWWEDVKSYLILAFTFQIKPPSKLYTHRVRANGSFVSVEDVQIEQANKCCLFSMHNQARIVRFGAQKMYINFPIIDLLFRFLYN